MRTTNLKKIKESLEQHIGETDVSIDVLCNTLICYHSFTGCDSVSAFAGKGKKRPWKIVLGSAEYVNAFAQSGNDWKISSELLDILERFVCCIYCKSGGRNLNELMYNIYCSKRGRITCDDLPPCFSSFLQHCKRANYQSCVWRLGFEINPDVPLPEDYGWHLDDLSKLEITWMTCKPAPDEVSSIYLQYAPVNSDTR